MLNIKTVFLDIDDTLWWFSENSKMALRHVFNLYALNQHIDYEMFRNIYTVKNRELWRKYQLGLVEKDTLVSDRFRYALQLSGYGGDCVKMATLLNTSYLDYLGSLPLLVPGARELLEYLQSRGYELNTLSNGFLGVQEQKLRSGGIAHFFTHNILSEQCGIAKPQRGIFDYALERSGACPETTVMIGDNPEADIEGAHHAGWHTIYFNIKNRDIAGDLADPTVYYLDEIKEIL